MKIILLDNIKKLGNKGSVVTVADGMALGKLIPTKKAIEATPANLAKLASEKKINQTTEKANDEHKNQAFSYLNNNPLQIMCHADHQGTLYQAIRTAQIYHALKSVLPKSIIKYLHESDILIEGTIKKIGKFPYKLFEKECILTIVGE